MSQCKQKRKSGPRSTAGKEEVFTLFLKVFTGGYDLILPTVLKCVVVNSYIGTLKRKGKDSGIIEIAAGLQHPSADPPQTSVCMFQ
jgi:hypothetical protein